MKGRLFTTVIFLLIMCIALAGCTDFPYAPKALPNGKTESFSVYVCGAVAHEGYFTAAVGTSCISVIEQAGLLPQSILPSLYTDTVDGSVTVLVVNYYDGKKQCYCVNANSPMIELRMPVDGLSDEVVRLLADWIEANGRFRNKRQVISALGEYASDYHYRLFVAKEDYAAG